MNVKRRQPGTTSKSKSTWWTAVVLFVLAVVSSGATEKPNIVFIMADDMGYECLGSNGSKDYRTPNLDRLAKEGLRFTHCYSTPLCTPSRVQIMTGKYNFRNYEESGYLRSGERTFAQMLKQAGYATAIAGKWQLNGLSYPDQYPASLRKDHRRPAAFGFDEWCLWQLTELRTKEGERYADPLIESNGGEAVKLDGQYGPDVFRDFLADFIERKKDGPFFVYYPMVLTHSPFVPTPDSPEWSNAGKRMTGSKHHFKDMVEYTDKIVGQLVAKLDAVGILEDTLVIFTGDNGTHPSIRTKMVDGRDYQGGKGSTPNAGTHVPMVAYWKGKTPGRVCRDLVDFTDFYPTFAEVAGVDVAVEPGLDGRSFLPQLKGGRGNPRNWVFCHYDPRWGKFQAARFVRDKRYKLYADGRFYDLDADELEQAGVRPEEVSGDVADARQRLKTVLDRMPEAPERPRLGKKANK